MSTGRRFIVKGRVQGVFFRDSTRKVARSLGLSGHAINLPDGDVEVMVFGDAARIDELESWLQAGPPLSRVIAVHSASTEFEERDSFEIG